MIAARPESIYDVFRHPGTREGTFDPSTSPLFDRVGFVVGAPRSGTTWLQQLLLVHPLVVTGGETHLFCETLPAIFDNFTHPNGMTHLRTWVSEAELLGATRGFCDALFEAQRAGARPDAQMVVEKTPNHRVQSALQAQIYPDGRYVHIVRDGRDVTSSQRTLWGHRDREFSDARRTAAAWGEAVRDIRTHLGGLAYLEVRYEDLVKDTPAALATIFGHLGLPYDDALCEAAAAFGRAPVNTAPTSAEVGLRKHKDDTLADLAVARAAGDLLVELEYAAPAEVERLRRARRLASIRADLREAARRAGPALVRAVTTARTQRAARAWDAPRRTGLELARAFAPALLAKDQPELTRLLAAEAVLQGTDPVQGADAVASALVARFGGWRTTQYRVSGGFALMTIVSDAGERALLRLREDKALATAIDVL